MLRINPHVRIEWTPPEDLKLPEAERSVLVFKPLTGAKFLELCDVAFERGEQSLKVGTVDAPRIVAACLVDWRVPDGAPFPGPAAAVEQIDGLTIQAAAKFIMESSALSEVTRKNSGSAPATSPASSSTGAPAPVAREASTS